MNRITITKAVKINDCIFEPGDKIQIFPRKKTEARRQVKPPYDFKNGILLLSYGMSPTGNHTITVELPNGRKKSIQTNQPGLFTTHRILRGRFRDIDSDDLVEVGKELENWVKRYEKTNQITVKESKAEIVNPEDSEFYDNIYNFYTVFNDEYIVYAEHLQDAVDYLADYVEEKGYTGYIGTEEEYGEEKYIIAGNKGIYLDTDIMAMVKENGEFI